MKTSSNQQAATKNEHDDVTPAISVVIAAFCAERTIGDAIRSVLSQTFQNFELIICDDGSEDGTAAVVTSFSDKRITLHRMAKNQGPGPARDRAIACARGTWITFLDADDQYEPERLDTLCLVANKYPNDLIADAVLDCHDTVAGLVPWGVVWDERRLTPLGAHVRTIKFEQFIGEERQLIQPFFRRELAMRLKASHGNKMNGEDVAFLFPFFAHGSVIRYVPRPMYLYRMTPGSLSTRNPKRFQLYREVFEEGRALFSGNATAIAAIDAKIARIRQLECYQSFLSPLRAGRFATAARVFAEHPWVLGEFAKRVVHRIPFHMSRVMHRGKPRRVG